MVLVLGLAMYWETLSRWICQRAQRDATALGVPLVFLQSIDECGTIDRDAAQRLLNIPNIHNTAHIPGVLPTHVGMRVRFTMKLNGSLGLVQEQKATVVDVVFKEEDRLRYNACAPGQLFRPKYLPAGIWLQVDDFTDSPIPMQEAETVVENLWETQAERDIHPDDQGAAHVTSWYKWKKECRARGLLLYDPVRQAFKWRSSENHTVTRTGFPLTHANYLTSTASQGQTIRAGVTIDCARIEQRGHMGTSDAEWWLHLYVMFSRATCMEDMLLLRPPPRALLEGGPPVSVRKALERFEGRFMESTELAAVLAAEMSIPLPS